MSTTTVLPFAGGEICSFDPSSAGASETTESFMGGAAYDSAYARCSLGISWGSYAASPTWTAASTFWLHFRLGLTIGSGVSTSDTIQFKKSGVTVARLLATSGSLGAGVTYALQTLQAGVMTTVSTLAVAWGVLNTWDIKLVGGASGHAALYSSGTLIGSEATGLDHTAWSGVDQIVPIGGFFGAAGFGAHYSEIICDSVSHIGERLYTDPPTGNGANTAWTGDYTAVDEVVYSDADKITSTAANDIETYTDSGAPTGTITAVIVAARANCGATGPQNIQMVIRRGGTNYFGATTALGAGYQACSYSWSTDPSTSSAWVTADALGAEKGVKAIA